MLEAIATAFMSFLAKEVMPPYGILNCKEATSYAKVRRTRKLTILVVIKARSNVVPFRSTLVSELTRVSEIFITYVLRIASLGSTLSSSILASWYMAILAILGLYLPIIVFVMSFIVVDVYNVSVVRLWSHE